MLFRSTMAAAALIALAGCAESASNETDGQTGAETEMTGDSVTDSEDAAQGSEIELAEGGLTSGSPGLHHAQIHDFGMPRAEIVALVTAIRGAPTETGLQEECGAGPLHFTDFGPLRLQFSDGEWVGWSMTGTAGDPPLESYQGAAIGAARADLDADELAVEETTIGAEFDYFGIAGLLSADTPDATVTDLWAGVNCIFR